MTPRKLSLIFICAGLAASRTAAAEEPELTPQRAAESLRRAAEFFRRQVSSEGGYLWRYSADLSLREGESKAGPHTVWVQPPGTPTVGDAYLDVYELTGDSEFLQAARETAHALARGQLQSGGWDYRIEFDARERQKYAYRIDGNPKGRNTTTLDDDTTQSAVRFLMRVDRALHREDAVIRGVVEFSLESLLKAQYPNGAWPQRFSEFPDAGAFPVKRASYPQEWPRAYPKADYRGYYTLNDNTLADMLETMLQAAEIYGDERYLAAAKKGGDFLVLAQMPEPQPAWAQQYNVDMHPAWARKFEPPAVTGGESRGALQTLMFLYRQTGDKTYLEPVPRALAYLEKSRLPDGRLARFYELKTNRPLYFTRDYELTDSPDDMPTHYGFIVNWDVNALAKQYREMAAADPKNLRRELVRRLRPPSPSRSLTAEAVAVVTALDERGAWVEPGQLKAHADAKTRRIIDTRTFAKNLVTLARYVAAYRR